LAIEVRHLVLEEALQEDVAHQLPVALTAVAGEPVLDIREEALAGLFAVVSDVDARVELLADGVDRRGVHLGGERRCVHRLTLAYRDEQVEELRRARQAAGVCRQDAAVAALHVSSSCACWTRCPPE